MSATEPVTYPGGPGEPGSFDPDGTAAPGSAVPPQPVTTAGFALEPPKAQGCGWCRINAADRIVAGRFVCGHCFPFRDEHDHPVGLHRSARPTNYSPDTVCTVHGIPIGEEEEA